MHRLETQAVLLGRNSKPGHRYVNPPIARASTVLARSFAEWQETLAAPASTKPERYYARYGTSTTLAFEEAIAGLEGAHRALVFPSGLAACTQALLALVSPGDHVLMTDSVYGPLRAFARGTLARLGVRVEFFPPREGAAGEARFCARTRAVYLESPGSLTFEVQDVAAIAAVAKRRGAWTLMDNTWASPVLFQPLAHGVDISLLSATKYVCGHSDAILGVASATRDAWERLAQGALESGQTASPEDCYTALRGVRTLPTRLRQHEVNGLVVAEWLRARPEVACVLHPALAEHPDHVLWRRDFAGASGLFGFILRTVPSPALASFFDSLNLFGLGVSWGGYESLMVPAELAGQRDFSSGLPEGALVRIHVGLEAPADLIADIEQAFETMKQHAQQERKAA